MTSEREREKERAVLSSITSSSREKGGTDELSKRRQHRAVTARQQERERERGHAGSTATVTVTVTDSA
jgi:hypothetical protein